MICSETYKNDWSGQISVTVNFRTASPFGLYNVYKYSFHKKLDQS